MKTLIMLAFLPGLAATAHDLMAQKSGNEPPQSQ